MIDADALMQAMYHRAFVTDGGTMWQSGYWVRYRAIEQVVEDQPTIELERPTGHWIKVDDAYNRISGRCSKCGWVSHLYEDDVVGMDFCPNCGAKMEEGK